MVNTNFIKALQDNLGNLSANDRKFAESLLSSYTLSEKQHYWVQQLAGRAMRAAAPATKIGDMSGLLSLFDKAAEHLKHPAIVAMSPVGEIKISVAGERARFPGTINVAEKGTFGQSKFYGRITRDGVFDARPDATPALIEYLTAFAAEPAKMAAQHGHQTGACCFCNKTLTDERSTSVGYGPICAGHYGLPWGE